MTSLFQEAEELFVYTQSLRRDFHRHPELGFNEFRTASIVAKELRKLNLEVTTGVAETGVVTTIDGAAPGAVVLLRFDMDALPVTEQTGAEYASENPGVMHACGHDAHTAVGLTVARLLHAHRQDLHGSVKLVFQPAEEGMGGAEKMIAEGVLENPKPDFTLALHMWNERSVGWIGLASGPTMAAAEVFRLRIIGKGGHGAIPNMAIDPVAAAAQIITALQTIVSRNVAPLQTAVVSVTTIHGGEAFNVIPPQVELQGTIRTFEPAVRQMVIQRFEQIAAGIGSAMGCQVDLEIQSLTPAVINDPHVTARVRKVVSEVFPSDVLAGDFRTMGSEDMAFMMQVIPSCYFFIGSADHEKGLDAPHHHPRFDIDERALPRAAALMTAVAIDLLK